MVTILGFILLIIFIVGVLIAFFAMFNHDRHQDRHPVLRNYPVLGKIRYFLEAIGPEMRQYWFNSDTEGKPFSRDEFEHVVKTAKYKRDVLAFGSKRDFDAEGYFIRNSLFPKQMEEIQNLSNNAAPSRSLRQPQSTFLFFYKKPPGQLFQFQLKD